MLGIFLPNHDAESLPLNRKGYLYWPKWNALFLVRAKNGVSRCSLCLKGQCTLKWAKVKCAKVVNRKELQWWQGPVMWLLEDLAAWGHVHLHSTNHQAYTCHIPSIYLVYANKTVIYQVYTWYILMEIVYIRYIPGIYHTWTFHMTTYSIYLTYTDSKLYAKFF